MTERSEQGLYVETEQLWVRRFCLASPIVALAAIPVFHRYLLWLLYLKPANSAWEFFQAFQSKPAIAASLAVAAIPWIWYVGLRLDSFLYRTRIPWALTVAGMILIASCLVLNMSRVTWFFVEWTKVRTPNPSFARNTLFWEQRNFEQSGSKEATTKVGLVGSSQTYQGFDLQQLETESPEIAFEKNTMAGFGPMQYPFLLSRICSRNFDTIVCQLSEFDFFREDSVPVSRLRWAASLSGVKSLAISLTKAEQWKNRGELADLAFAGVVPLWRQRDHIRRSLFGYWWKKSDPPQATEAQPTRLADAPALNEAIGFLKSNVGNKKLVETNFESFRRFAQELSRHDIRLIVIEGQVHPAARSAYDTDNMQQRTRERIAAMADEWQFTYIDEQQLPDFDSSDFADAYHLNEIGRARLTHFLSTVLAQ